VVPNINIKKKKLHFSKETKYKNKNCRSLSRISQF